MSNKINTTKLLKILDVTPPEQNIILCGKHGIGKSQIITEYFEKKNKQVVKATFNDSLKIIPFSVDAIAKSFNLPISKLSIDYNLPREKGHILTSEENEYIKNDVLIVAKALKVLFDEDLKKMTQRK